MINFDYLVTTKIFFGKNTIARTGAIVKDFGGRKVLLVHYGIGPVVDTGILDRVLQSLGNAGIPYFELSGVEPNPKLSLVYQGVELARRERINFLLAVGGGSVIDTAKAIAAGAMESGDVWDFFLGKRAVSSALPIGVVLTIPASGSEAGDSAVITQEESKLKRDFTSELIRPRFAILDPEVTISLPASQTAYGAADIMAHVLERYFTTVEKTELTDRLCEAVLRTVIHNLPIVLEVPEEYDARAEIMWAGTLAHNGLLSTGRIDDWASHMIEHEISGETNIAHGAGLAAIFPAWMKYVYKQRLTHFIKFAIRVWDVEYDYNSPERTAREGIRQLENFFTENGLPTRLSQMGIEAEMLPLFAERINYDDQGQIGNFVKLSKADVLAIYHLAF